MKNFTIEIDDRPNLEFTGDEIGAGSTRDNNRDATRWTVYKLYRTQGGSYVAQIKGYSQWDGEVTRYDARVCKTEDEVKTYLGFSDAAKEVYAEAGIDASVKVA